MFWGWMFLYSSSAESPGWMGEQFWHIFANERLAKAGGGTLGASLLPQRNPRRLVADGTGVTVFFLDYLSPWEETRGALNGCVLACESTLRTGQKNLGKHPKGNGFAAPSYGNQPRQGSLWGRLPEMRERPSWREQKPREASFPLGPLKTPLDPAHLLRTALTGVPVDSWLPPTHRRSTPP